MRVIQVVPTLEVGGAERVVQGLCTELNNNPDVSVMVISLYTKTTTISEDLSAKGIEVRFLDKKPGFDLSLIKKLKAIIREYQPDVIHSHLYSLNYVALASLFQPELKKVYTVHSLAQKEIGPLYRLLYKIYFNYFKFVPVAISQEVQQSILQTYQLSAERVPIIDNGIDLSKMMPKTDYALHQPPRILHVANFTPAKNHQMLLNSLKIVLDSVPVKLLLAGHGPLMETIKDQAKTMKLEDSVEFLGQRSDISELMNSSDLFVLPSFWEGQPVTLIEAMASGLPIVATEVGGIPSLIDSGVNGILTRVHENDFAQGILRALTDQTLREEYGKHSIEKSKHFSAQEMTAQYISLYREKK